MHGTRLSYCFLGINFIFLFITKRRGLELVAPVSVLLFGTRRKGPCPDENKVENGGGGRGYLKRPSKICSHFHPNSCENEIRSLQGLHGVLAKTMRRNGNPSGFWNVKTFTFGVG